MRAKFVYESLNESFIKFGRSTQGLQEDFPVFKSASTAYILRALQQVNNAHFTAGKLDLDKFYHFLKGAGSMYKYKKSFEEMKQALMDIAPVLDIVEQIKFSRADKSEVKMQKRALDGGIPLEEFDNAEVPAELAEDDDIVVRSMFGDTEPAYYRFDRKLSPHERNMLRVAYAFTHGAPEKNTWQNYLEAVPARVGFIKKHGRSFEKTSDVGGFRGSEYN